MLKSAKFMKNWMDWIARSFAKQRKETKFKRETFLSFHCQLKQQRSQMHTLMPLLLLLLAIIFVSQAQTEVGIIIFMMLWRMKGEHRWLLMMNNLSMWIEWGKSFFANNYPSLDWEESVERARENKHIYCISWEILQGFIWVKLMMSYCRFVSLVLPKHNNRSSRLCHTPCWSVYYILARWLQECWTQRARQQSTTQPSRKPLILGWA